MLVLGCKVGESVIIGDNDIKITVTDVKSNRVKLAFEADKSIVILREKVFNRDKAEKEQNDAIIVPAVTDK